MWNRQKRLKQAQVGHEGKEAQVALSKRSAHRAVPPRWTQREGRLLASTQDAPRTQSRAGPLGPTVWTRSVCPDAGRQDAPASGPRGASVRSEVSPRRQGWTCSSVQPTHHLVGVLALGEVGGHLGNLRASPSIAL